VSRRCTAARRSDAEAQAKDSRGGRQMRQSTQQNKDRQRKAATTTSTASAGDSPSIKAGHQDNEEQRQGIRA